METVSGLAELLVCIVMYAVGLLTFALVEIGNEIIAIFAFFGMILGFIIPPLNVELPTLPPEVIGSINWVFPIGYLSQLFGYGLTAFGIYRILKWWANRRKTPVQPRLF